jgi:type VI secretion system protein ImpM
MTMPVVPGLYGKLPAVGDFVLRRLPAPFVKSWDGWIQEALTASREQLANQWLDVYLTSPIWRFILSSGNCGEKASIGILMPSVDKVGRYFPLTLAAMIDKHEALPHLFFLAADWFDTLERLALSALEEDIRLDAFDRELQGHRLNLKEPTDSARPLIKEYGKGNGNGSIRIEMDTLDLIPEALHALTACLLRRCCATYSLWSTAGSDLLHPSLLVYQGLPPATDFAGFLTGDWLQSGVGRLTVITLHADDLELAKANVNKTPVHTEGIRPIQWRSCGRSDVGNVREINEDAFLDNPTEGIWAVADGMGGHLAGDEASQAVVDALANLTPGGTLEALTADVKACLQSTNANLIRRSRENNPDQIMGSTVVVMLAVDRHCAAIWAGDSRLYRFRDGLLTQLSRDHSPDADMATPDRPLSGAPTEMRRSNVITRAVGADETLALDTITFNAAGGDTYLLCSDGLDKALNQREIENMLNRQNPDECSQALIDMALSRGARDNVTVVVVAAAPEMDVNS